MVDTYRHYIYLIKASLFSTGIQQSLYVTFIFTLDDYEKLYNLFSYSTFYKSFVDPIEIVAFSIQSPFALIGRNNDDANVYGVEFEVRKKLVESSFGNLDINLNFLSYTFSIPKNSKLLFFLESAEKVL